MDFLLRSRHNCALPEGARLWEVVYAQMPLGEIRFTLPSRRGQKARLVRQEVRMKRVALAHSEDDSLKVCCVIAREVGCPAGTTPVEWRLLTNREVPDFDAAVELIGWYRACWEIETFFHVLKNGCCVEALQLATIEKLERALAVYMVVAWQIARLMRLGRTCRDLDAELLFEREEWQAAYQLMEKHVPKKVPPLNEVVRLIAMLGGFLGRKGVESPA